MKNAMAMEEIQAIKATKCAGLHKPWVLRVVFFRSLWQESAFTESRLALRFAHVGFSVKAHRFCLTAASVA